MQPKTSPALPVVIITLGIGWLLSTMGIGPSINWVWTLGLAVGGLLVFALSGFNKATIVVGPMLLVASILSVLRQSGKLNIDLEVPILVIVSGVLLLVARLPSIPPPQWLDHAMIDSESNRRT